MEVGILFIIIISILVYNGFRTRCPNCGKYTLHSKDKEAIKEEKERYEKYEKIGLNEAFGRDKPGYTTTQFICNSCKHSFCRKTALIWLTTANKIGEEITLEEYRKLKSKKEVQT